MDLAEYRTLFVLSFTTPAFDPDVAPSFGTLLATINVALSMLSEVESFYQRIVALYLKRILDVCLCFVDGEEERAGVLEHCLNDIIRGDSGPQVCFLPLKT